VAKVIRVLDVVGVLVVVGVLIVGVLVVGVFVMGEDVKIGIAQKVIVVVGVIVV
jgi:hypothetical protein